MTEEEVRQGQESQYHAIDLTGTSSTAGYEPANFSVMIKSSKHLRAAYRWIDSFPSHLAPDEHIRSTGSTS